MVAFVLVLTELVFCVAEPILPRRRKHPLLAYRCHEVLGLTAAASEDCLDSARSDRRVSIEQAPASVSGVALKCTVLPRKYYYIAMPELVRE